MTTAARSSASVLELLRWLSDRPRTYPETIEAWRTSCPQLSAWDGAIGDGLVAVVRDGGGEDARVLLTAAGRAALDGGADDAAAR